MTKKPVLLLRVHRGSVVLVLFFVPLRELYRYDLLLFSIHQNAPLFISGTKKKERYSFSVFGCEESERKFFTEAKKISSSNAHLSPRTQPPTRSSPLRPGNSLSLSLSGSLCKIFKYFVEKN